jgi:DNA invertase Pin-like site-specific DNA recombinase
MKAIGLARQSKGDADSLSVEAQDAKIRAHCKAEGWTVTDVRPERDRSGFRNLLDARPGLRACVEAVEAGKADVVVVAYFTRLFRNGKVRAAVIERVEAAGGKLLALDVGRVGHANAAEWLTTELHGVIAEHVARVARDYANETHSRLIAEGKHCGGKMPLGYALDADGRLTPVPADAALVRDAYRMRVRGDSLEAIRAHLGVRFASVVSRLLANRVYLGELRHGPHVNLKAHDAIIDGPLFRKVQERHTPRGKRPASDRLLARLDVLHCATCGSRMVVHGAKAQVQVYRCGGQGCKRKLAISCHLADEAVAHAVRVALRDREGRAGVDVGALTAERDRRVTLLDSAIETFSGIDPERTAAKLAELEAAVVAAEDALAEGREAAGFVVNGAATWDEFHPDARRDLIRSAVKSAVVGPGVGKGRVRVSLSPSFTPEAILDTEATGIRDDLAEIREARVVNL